MMPVRPRDEDYPEESPPSGKRARYEHGESDGEGEMTPEYTPTDAAEEDVMDKESVDDLYEELKAGNQDDEPTKKAPKEVEIEKEFICPPCEPPEARFSRVLHSPCKPTAEEIEKHYATHLPYRNWCPICVAAKAKEAPHTRDKNAKCDDEDSKLPIISADYTELNPDEKDVNKVKMMISKDETTGNTAGFRCRVKGPGDEWALKRLKQEIQEWGRNNIIFKTDGEPAMIAVQSRLQGMREGVTVPRNPPAYNPQSNGPCEKAVQDVVAQVRTLKLGLEARIGAKIPDDHPVVEWIMPHACFLLNKFSIGHDGMTAHERLVGKKWSQPVIEVGEKVLAKLALRRQGQGKKGQQKKKLASRAIPATYAGIVPRTGEHVVIKDNGDAVKCRTVYRVPLEERWSRERIFAIKGTPRLPSPSSASPEEIAARVVDEHEEDREKAETAHRGEDLRDPPGVPQPREVELDIRRPRINDRILSKYGHSKDCQGCDHKLLGLPGHRAHTDACRARIYAEMKADPTDATAVEKNELKMQKKDEPNESAEPEDNVDKDAKAKEDVVHGGGQLRTSPKVSQEMRTRSRKTSSRLASPSSTKTTRVRTAKSPIKEKMKKMTKSPGRRGKGSSSSIQRHGPLPCRRSLARHWHPRERRRRRRLRRINDPRNALPDKRRRRPRATTTRARHPARRKKSPRARSA